MQRATWAALAMSAVVLCGCPAVAPPCGDDGGCGDAGLPRLLAVALAGDGHGTVTSSPAGIDCGTTCSALFTRAVTLTAWATPGSVFTGWSGACGGTGACQLPMDGQASVVATFLRASWLAVEASGPGTVVADAGALACRGTCEATYPAGTAVALTATADPGASFLGWSGACAGTLPACGLTLDDDAVVLATFGWPLSISRAGSGEGVVWSDAGLDCGTSCAGTFPAGPLTLTATPSPWSSFDGWSGACSGTGPCEVTLAGPATVTATFTQRTFYTVTVERSGTGVGRVVQADGGALDCGNVCSAQLPAGQQVVLRGLGAGTRTTVGDLTSWAGPCSGARECSFRLLRDTTVGAVFTLRPNLVFVTSAATTGAVGGLSAADALCGAEAADAGFGGTYRAYLSTDTVDAVSRLAGASGWVRADGLPVATTPAAVGAGRLLYPVRLSARGEEQGNARLWTGTGLDGTRSPRTCSGFTDGTAAASAEYGDACATGVRFQDRSIADCSRAYSLLCFGVDRAAAVTLGPPPSFRLAFLSESGWQPGGGLDGADALCQREADAAGRPGTFRALLAGVGTAPASRFDPTGPTWVRVDGVRLAVSALMLIGIAEYWDAPLDVTLAGALLGTAPVWTGARYPFEAGTAASTCNGWFSSTTGTGWLGEAGHSYIYESMGAQGSTSERCSVAVPHLWCLQL